LTVNWIALQAKRLSWLIFWTEYGMVKGRPLIFGANTEQQSYLYIFIPRIGLHHLGRSVSMLKKKESTHIFCLHGYGIMDDEK